MKQDLIYEVRLEIDADIEQEFDAWLADHVAEMLCLDGFMSAEILVPTDKEKDQAAHDSENSSPPGRERVVRQVQYHISDQAKLEEYFAEHAHRMREQGVQRFGTRFSASRAVYDLGVRPARNCQNCNATLRGQYCEECGQRDKHRIISLWELLRDLIGDVFEFDSRVWRSLRPLLFKPGQLTTEYLRGRRVHYTPPLRLYLITSLIFFLVVFFNTDDVTFNGDPDVSDVSAAAILEKAAGGSDPSVIIDAVNTLENVSGDSSASEIASALTTLDEVSDDADVSEIIAAVRKLGNIPVDASEEAPDAQTDPDADPAADPEPEPDPASDSETDSGTLSENCDKLNVEGSPWDDAIETRAKQVCRNLTAEGGATRFLRDLVDNIPGMMFFFLPVIALIMAFLYPLSKRYYVEHLLFFVHFHSFFFLLMTLTVLVARLPEVFPGQAVGSGLLTLVVIFYIPIYLFVAMRRVYGQSFGLTALKYGVLGVAYLVSLVFSFTAMAFLTALSV